MNSDARLRPANPFSLVSGQIVRFVLAPLVSSYSGFYTMDFFLSGVYSWPRASRMIALTFAVVILSYEFVYKEQPSHMADGSGSLPVKVVLFSCVIPYMLGTLALVFLFALSP